MKDKKKKKIISIVAAVTVLLVGMFALMGSSLAAEETAKRARGANPDCPVVNGEAELGEGLKVRQGNAVENRNRDGSGLGGGQREGGNGVRRNTGENQGSKDGRDGAGKNSEVAKQRRAENRANCDCEQPGTGTCDRQQQRARDCEQPGACAPRGSQQRGKGA
ncbi:MAG: hypothetical protein GX900_05760 [Clostridiaceae bacterium]|jgi:hypothetical protein|nr:hypothetical protein [Clostridiaceae bacterium]